MSKQELSEGWYYLVEWEGANLDVTIGAEYLLYLSEGEFRFKDDVDCSRLADAGVWDKEGLPLGLTDPSPLSTQVGGTHYIGMAIQPVEYITKNNLGYCEGNIVKYISRYKNKGGVEDLNKIIHYTNLLKENVYGC